MSGTGSSSRPSASAAPPVREPPPFAQFLEEDGGKVEPAFYRYGDAQAAYYDALLEQRRCLFCGARDAERIATFEWSTTISRARDAIKAVATYAFIAALTGLLTGVAHGAAHAQGETITFTTRHYTCRACFANWNWRSRLLRVASSLAVAIALIGLVFGGLLLTLALFGHPIKTSDRAAMRLWGGIAFTSGVIGVIMWPLTQRWSVPVALRHVPGGAIRPGAAKMLKKK